MRLSGAAGAEEHEPALRIFGEGARGVGGGAEGGGLDVAVAPAFLQGSEGQPFQRAKLAIAPQRGSDVGAPDALLADARLDGPEFRRANVCFDRDPAAAVTDVAVRLT